MASEIERKKERLMSIHSNRSSFLYANRAQSNYVSIEIPGM